MQFMEVTKVSIKVGNRKKAIVIPTPSERGT